VDPVIAFVALVRIAGSLPVLRWRLAGALLAVVVDLLDLLLFNLFVVYGGWGGFDGYQAFDKWADQVYLATFLIVAVRDFAPIPRTIAIGLYLYRLVGFAAFEVGLAPREALILFPNLFEFWFIAVAAVMHVRPTLTWTPVRAAALLAPLLVAKLVQEWALHVGRLFDGSTFLDALDAIWRALTAPFGG
jgi:hypothetical protein